MAAFNSGEFRGHVSLEMNTGQLFRSHSCVQFSGMACCAYVSEHAKMTR